MFGGMGGVVGGAVRSVAGVKGFSDEVWRDE